MHKLFPSQLDNETIHVVVREHWILLFGKILVWFFFLLFLVLFNKLGTSYAPILFEGQSGQIMKLAEEIYSLFLVLAIFLIWTLWYLNIQIITNLRIVDVDQIGLFSHSTSELHIENIEDVTSEINGVFGTIFGFGMVYVQTAGTIERFEFDNVPNPGAVEKLILELYEQIPRNHTP